MAEKKSFWNNIFGGNKQTFENTSDLNNAKVYKHQQFGTPLVKIGKGDITRPYVDSSYVGKDVYVRFGHDNLYPSLIDQMYYQSPLHSAIIDFQINASIGGGWTIEGEKDGKEKVDEYAFVKKLKLNKLIKSISYDIKMHKRSHFLIYKNDDGVPVKAERVLPSKVRYNKDASIFWISENWISSDSIRMVPAYDFLKKDKVSMFSYIDLDSSPGQDVYPLDKTISSFNWCFLDGASSDLQKKNAQRSIFGSLVIKRPKEFDSTEEFQQFKMDVSNKEGEVVPVLVFAADGKENLPDVEAFPANQNDGVFKEMFIRIDEKICQAHSINPVLLLEGTGGLGSGSDITAVYPIYEKNVIIPFRCEIEEVVNDLMDIFNITGEFKLKNFQIIDGSIVDSTDEIEVGNGENAGTTELVVNDNLKGLSAKENQDIYRIIRDHGRGKLNESIAVARLMAYGFDRLTAKNILKNK
jgi:hypothetical protein